jgi:pyruvate/2-oxoglutarate dehydrogenase complex dihydrolipoamide acyltransferase (E2) component
VLIRDVLDLTVSIDHNVVDGAPATRFGAEFRRRMEDGVMAEQVIQALPDGLRRRPE